MIVSQFSGDNSSTRSWLWCMEQKQENDKEIDTFLALYIPTVQ